MSDRRRFLKVVGASAATLGVASLSAACGSDDEDGSTNDTTGGGGGAGGGGAGGAGATTGGQPDLPDTLPDSYTPIGNVTDVPPGELYCPDNLGVYVGIDAGGLYAMSVICKHNGCSIKHNAGGGPIPGGLRCGCHGSEYDMVGNNTKGPAQAPLDHFMSLVDKAGTIGVDGAVMVDGSYRAPVPS